MSDSCCQVDQARSFVSVECGVEDEKRDEKKIDTQKNVESRPGALSVVEKHWGKLRRLAICVVKGLEFSSVLYVHQ